MWFTYLLQQRRVKNTVVKTNTFTQNTINMPKFV